MAPRWTQKECAYFLKEVLPRSKYSTGQFSEHGLDFQELAMQMQRDLDASQQSCRIYNGDSLFQHWRQTVRVGVTSRRGCSGYSAPNQPGQSSNQDHVGFGGIGSAEEEAAADRANRHMGENKFSVFDMSSPAGSYPGYNNSLLQSGDNVMASTSSFEFPTPGYFTSLLQPADNSTASVSSFELPPLPTSTYLPSSSFHALATTSNDTNSSAMAPPPDFNATFGITDESLLDHGLNLGEAAVDGQKRSEHQTDHGETDTKPMTDLTEHVDTTNNVRKRRAFDNDIGNTSTQAAAKKPRTLAADLKYTVPDSVAELKPGSDPASPSPAAKKTRGRAKALIPKKKKKTIEDGDAAPATSSPLEAKKPKTAAARKNGASKATIKAANVSTPVSIPTGDDDIATDENSPAMSEDVIMKYHDDPFAAGATKVAKGRGTRGGRGGCGQARGRGHQHARHHSAAHESSDGDAYEEDEDMLEPAPRQQPRQYQEYEFGGMGDGRYYAAVGAAPSYYPPPPSMYRNAYHGAQLGFRQNPSYQVNAHHSHTFKPYGPQYHPTQYDAYGLNPIATQLPGANRASAASRLDLHPNMPVIPPFGAPLSPSFNAVSQQADVPVTTDHRTGGAFAAPRPSSYQSNVLSMTDRPASSISNNPASVHGAEQSTKENVAVADSAQRSRGRIYISNGDKALEVMVETCPCCRRGFE